MTMGIARRSKSTSDAGPNIRIEFLHNPLFFGMVFSNFSEEAKLMDRNALFRCSRSI